MNIVIMVLTLGAYAADVRYALTAELEVPRRGPVRLELSPDWVARCPDPTTYVLHDALGREVPYAVRTSDDAPPGPETLTWEPMERTPWSWTYLVHGPRSGAPTVGLSVRGLPRDRVVEATVRQDGQLVTKVLLWNLPDTGAGVRETVALPPGHRQGPWRIDLHVVNFWRARPWAEFSALTTQVDQVEPVLWRVEVEEPVVIGPSQSRLSVPLPRSGLPVRGVRVAATDPMFSRPATVHDGRGTALGQGQLERFLYGTAPVDVDRLPVHATVSRALSLDLTDDRSRPLQVEHVDLELRGLALLATGGEPGRWTIAGCGPAGAPYDVERLSAALMDQATPRIVPGAPRANEAWTEALVTEGLAGPAARLKGRSVALATLEGPAALVRTRLPPAVLATLRTDLADLRWLDASGHQLPYLAEDAGPVPVPDVSYTVSEAGTTTVMQIELPHAGLPIEQLVLYAERTRFQRQVEVKGEGAPTRLSWEGSGETASRLIVPLRGRAPRQLTVRIDNGDNAPLPLLPPSLSMASTEVTLVLPAQGAELHMLRSEIAPPRYDLALLRSEVLDGPALEAAVRMHPAPAEPVPAPRAITAAPLPQAPPQAPWRWWVTPLVGGCALLLGALAIRMAGGLGGAEEVDPTIGS
jgi:hypothetical protein